jgi:Tol biopolymer transport system component
MRLLTRAFAVAFALGATPWPAVAQYFGQNQVEYETFDFRILRTLHFDIYYYPEGEKAANYAAQMAERAYARISRLLDHELSNRQALILYASAPQFRQTNVVSGSGEGTGGVTEILKRRIVLPFAGPLKETDHVLTHELIHAFQFDMTGARGGVARAGGPSVMRYPLWFVEGMAEYLSIGPEDANTTMWMRDAVRADKMPSLGRLEDPRFFPYRYGQALWAYVGGRFGDDAVGRVLKASRRGDVKFAFQQVLRRPADSIVTEWREATKAAFAPLKDLTKPPVDYGRVVIEADEDEGNYNIAPSLSPDGSKVVFLSSRDLFSIDMYLADAKTGKVEKRIVRTDVDAHFESIQFIGSAGVWDPAGERFAFGAVREGRPVISILNVPEDKIEREIALPELGEVFTPTWSPDGRRVAFSALVGGLSDLYVYDLERSELKRLTDDAYADMQPAWSPDGRTLAWATDRFSTNLDNLAYGNYRLGLFDLGTGTGRELAAFPQGKHINPQWAPDGASMYFVSDQNGISNVYRITVADGRIAQVTNLYAGVSGITDLSPALTVASRSGEVGFNVYSNDGYSVYVADDPTVLAGRPVAERLPGGDPAMLPPRERQSQVASLKANAFYGLTSDTAGVTQRPYRSRLGLDYISQPSLAVGADRFGTYIGGGASLFWSDMLGGHNLATGVQFQGTTKDISALLGYSNTYHRLNWGVALQQIPYRTGYVGYAQGLYNGVPAILEQTTLFRQTNRQADWVFAYPFSRVRRIEGSVGYANIGYSIEQIDSYFSLATGEPLDQVKTQLASYPGLNLGQGSAALVYDNSIFAFTGPILGQRYRMELGTTQGSLNFQTVLADYRKYVMPARPFTLAARVLHFGRYGADSSESTRMQPLFLGYDGLVRGYSYGSFDNSDCPTSSCPAFYNLFGTKMLVGNLELRFPPLGIFRAGGPFGFLPLDLFAFGDAGLAWGCTPGVSATSCGTAADKPFFLDGDRKPFYSAGGGFRFNFFGFVIAEMAVVHPFNRGKGTHIQWSFTPGF